ncbi:MAG: Zn-dependent alcohol dehydrogenase [SAR202 cluster bacterium]|nr:Zn-dependent alcohol dehydrogenase [SAR202 cluster bacterium]
MKAAVLHEVNQPLRMEEVDIAPPGPREVVVRTGASGVCHSDLHFVEGLYATVFPVVLGHEAAGTVEEVGSLVDYVKPGDRVICCLSVFCGHCERCTTGRPVLCSRTGLVRGPDETPRLSQGGDPVTQFANLGSFAEKMLVHENSLVKIDQDIPFEQMALIGCGATTGLGAAMNTAKVEPGSTVAVIGCGGVGLNAIQGAVLAGALRVIAIDAVENKLSLARKFGATDVIDASSGDVETRVKDLTRGGVDYSFEAIGKKETAELAFGILRAGGTATIIGMIPQGTKIELDGSAFLRERRIQGSSMGSNHFRVDMPRYVDFYLQGRLKLDELVTRRLKLEEVNEAFQYMKEGSVARSVLVFE